MGKKFWSLAINWIIYVFSSNYSRDWLIFSDSWDLKQTHEDNLKLLQLRYNFYLQCFVLTRNTRAPVSSPKCSKKNISYSWNYQKNFSMFFGLKDNIWWLSVRFFFLYNFEKVIENSELQQRIESNLRASIRCWQGRQILSVFLFLKRNQLEPRMVFKVKYHLSAGIDCDSSGRLQY